MGVALVWGGVGVALCSTGTGKGALLVCGTGTGWHGTGRSAGCGTSMTGCKCVFHFFLLFSCSSDVALLFWVDLSCFCLLRFNFLLNMPENMFFS